MRAGHVVVAAGAIETARLLLASEVGTAHDQVGRYLQGHVYAGAVGVFDEPVQDCVGPGPSISTTDHRHHNDGILGGGILANEFVPIPIEAYAKLSGAGVIPAWGEAGADAMRETYTRAQFVVGPIQEVPAAASRVTLEPSVTDGNGMPAVRLLSAAREPNDVAQRRVPGRARGRSGCEPAAPGRPGRCSGRSPRVPARASTRPAAAAWAPTPARSVTDPWGRVWGHDGVTIADGSLHVTNGGVNPVLTILALAWRVSERLAGEL